MAWTGVITNAGVQLLSQWRAGTSTLSIVGAEVGNDTNTTAGMKTQTQVECGEGFTPVAAQVIRKEAVQNGTRFKVMVGPGETAYTAHQIGLLGQLSIGSSTATLLAVVQDTTGVAIPSASTDPDFVFTIYITTSIDNSGTLEITVDPTTYATQGMLEDAIGDLEDTLGGAATKGVANDLTTASAGSKVLDAYQGKALKDLFDSIVQGAGTVQYIYSGATFITSSKKDIAITIPTNRIIPSARTIASVHLNSLSLRQDGNYLYNKGTGENFSDMEVTVTKRATGIHLSFAYKPNGAIEKQEYPNATNNAAVGVHVDISITWA